MLPGATKDGQLISEDWHKLGEKIAGVSVSEVRHVPRDHGVLTEIFRPEWDPSGQPVVQIYQSRLFAGSLVAWSCHERTTDRLFVCEGLVKIVLFDDREGSKTRGKLQELYLGEDNHCLVKVPVGVWNGFKGVGLSPAYVVNCATIPHDPGEVERLDPHQSHIPYDWSLKDR